MVKIALRIALRWSVIVPTLKVWIWEFALVAIRWSRRSWIRRSRLRNPDDHCRCPPPCSSPSRGTGTGRPWCCTDAWISFAESKKYFSYSISNPDAMTQSILNVLFCENCAPSFLKSNLGPWVPLGKYFSLWIICRSITSRLSVKMRRSFISKVLLVSIP